MYEIELTPESISHKLYDSRTLCLKFASFITEYSKLNLIFDNEDGTFPKKFNARHWRTLQAIGACSQICNGSTWCLEIIPPNC